AETSLSNLAISVTKPACALRLDVCICDYGLEDHCLRFGHARAGVLVFPCLVAADEAVAVRNEGSSSSLTKNVSRGGATAQRLPGSKPLLFCDFRRAVAPLREKFLCVMSKLTEPEV